MGGIRVAAFALLHLHGVGAVAGNPVFPESWGEVHIHDVDVTQGAELFFGELMAGIAIFNRMRCMGEKDVVWLLLVRKPYHFFSGTHVVSDKSSFCGAFAELSLMTECTVLSPGQGGKTPVRP